MITYYIKEIELPTGMTLCSIEKNDGDLWVSFPVDETNFEYQAYLAWVAEGNEPEEWTEEQE